MSAQSCVAILCDNESCAPEFGSEWGAFHGPHPPQRALWLWDTGKTGLFLKNAAAMGVDVARAEGLALSHGHYDHTGGIAAPSGRRLQRRHSAHPTCASDRWSADPKGRATSVRRPRCRFLSRQAPITELAPGLTMITDIPRAQGRFQAVQAFPTTATAASPTTSPTMPSLCSGRRKPGGRAGMLPQRTGQFPGLRARPPGHKILPCRPGGIASLQGRLERAVEETADALHRHGVRLLVAGHCTGADRFHDLQGLLRHCKTEYMAAGRRYIF